MKSSISLYLSCQLRICDCFTKMRSVASLFLLFTVLFAGQVSAQNDPDLIEKGTNKIDKEEFMRLRSEAINLKRGIDADHTFIPAQRINAVRQMDNQKAAILSKKGTAGLNLLASSWIPIGPAPIPNGQVTSGVQTPVSGRVTAIAVHPTNPNIVYVGTAQGGLYRTLNGGTTWTTMMDNALSLAIGAVAISPSSPDIVFVGTGEANFSFDSFFGVGIYRIDNASSGSPVLSAPLGGTQFNGRSISEIIVHPTNPAIIFVASTSGVGGISGSASILLPSRGVYRSTDATSANPAFTQIGVLASPNNNINVRDIAIDPANPNILLANLVASGGGIYRSTNALSATPTWTQVFTFSGGNANNLTAEFAVVHPSGDVNATIYAAVGNTASANGAGRLLKSIDGGATFSQINSLTFCTPQCFYNIAVDVDPTNKDVVYLGGTGARTFVKSINGGSNFTASQNDLHTDTHVIAVAPSLTSTIYFGSDGGIYKSTNNGTTWASLNNGDFQATQFMSLAVHPTDPNFTIGGTQDNGTIYQNSAGNWIRADFGDGGYSAIDQNAINTTNVTMYHTYFNQTNNLIGFARVLNTPCATEGNWSFKGIYGGGVVDPFVYCDGTTDSFNGISISEPVLFYAPLVLGPGNPNTVYFGTSRLYRSANKGDIMPAVSQSLVNPISAIGISPQNDNVRLVGVSDGGLWGTTTGSTTLTNLDVSNTVPNNFIGRAVIDPNNQTTAYVTLSGFGVVNVWKTTNLDNANPTWTAAASGIPPVPVNAFVIDPANSDNLYAGTDIGVYVSTDGGVSWTPFGTGLPVVAVFGMAKTANNKLRIATHGRGMWEIGMVSVCTPPTVNAPTVTQPTCTTATGTIVVNAGGAGTLEYSVDNGTTYQASNTFSNLAPGSYNIKVRLQGSPDCLTAYNQNPVVLVNPKPISAIIASEPVEFCSGGSVMLYAFTDIYLKVLIPQELSMPVTTAIFGASVSITPISGDFVYLPDGAASYLGCSPFAAGSLAGKVAVLDRGICNFTDKVKNAQNAGATGVIIVNNIPSPPGMMGGADLTITIPAVMVSQADGLVLKNLIASGLVNGMSFSPNTYLWSNGATTQNISVTQSGAYSVKVTSPAGCQVTSNEIQVTVNPLPDCSITSTPSNSVYTGGISTNLYLGYGAQSTTLSLSPSGDGPYTYSWTGAGLSNYNTSNPVFTPTSEGSFGFTVEVTNVYGCKKTCSITICVLDIRERDKKGKLSGKVFICHVPTQTPENVQTLAISPNAVPEHLTDHPGDRLGKCTDVICGASLPLTRLSGEGTHTDTDELTVSVSPNPSASDFSIQVISNSNKPVTIRVLDAAGVVRSTSSNLIKGSVFRVGSALKNGTYFAEVIQGENRRIVKLIKAN